MLMSSGYYKYPDLAQSVERMTEDHVDADRNRESGLKQ